MKTTWLAVLALLTVSASADSQVQPRSAEEAVAARKALLEAIAKACTEKYGDRTSDTMSCIPQSAARFDRKDRSPAIGPVVTCMQMGSNVACH
jgi:hypothetical protein